VSAIAASAEEETAAHEVDSARMQMLAEFLASEATELSGGSDQLLEALKDNDQFHEIVVKKLQRDKTRAELELQKLQNTQFQEDMEQRRTYARKVVNLAIIWLSCVLAVVIMSALPTPWKLTFSDNVLIALLTTTTINVIGLAVVVVNYLFYRPKP
jgi:hypothetical protein